MLLNIPHLLNANSQIEFESGIVLFLLFGIGAAAYSAYKKYREDKIQEIDGARLKAIRYAEAQKILGSANSVLFEHLSYYRNLSDSGRQRFLKKLGYVIAEKRFYAKEGLDITNEMIILAAAGFVQITFGLKNDPIPFFNRVYLYPKVFYNKLLDRHLRGSTSPRGIIRLSWRHLKHGYADDLDGINLGLHEIAHALKISIKSSQDKEFAQLENKLNHLLHAGTKAVPGILNGKIDVLRKYAAANTHELFACAVEVFFEKPNDLKTQLPELFYALIHLLNQDPTNPVNDYGVEEQRIEIPTPTNSEYHLFKSNEFMPAMILIGFTVSWVAILMIQDHMITSPISIALLTATLVIAGLGLFFRRLLVSGYTTPALFLLFLVVGWLSITLSVTLVANRFIPVYTITESYPIAWVMQYSEGRKTTYKIALKGSDYDSIEIEWDDAKIAKQNENARAYLKLHYGLFGIKVLDEVEVKL